MKKLLTVLLTLFMIFTLVGCNSKQEEMPTIDESQIDEPIVGGYQEVEDKNLTPELIEMFEKAFDGFVGANYTPVMLEATQVVAGTNYKFKADGTKTTDPLIQGTYYVYINKDLQGNISLLDIEIIEEHELKKFEPDVKLDTELKKDVTQMSFWVVFYDQYGNELQREVLKYGSIPSYKKDLPEGFEKWVYKNSQKDVGTLKAITGNTYYQAICHAVSHKSSNSNPTKEPNYFYFKNIGEAETCVAMSFIGICSKPLYFEYSRDKNNWKDIVINDNEVFDDVEKLSLAVGETIYIKAKTSNPYMIESGGPGAGDNGVVFVSLDDTNAMEVGGSIMTLLDSTDTLRDISGKTKCFMTLFQSMKNIKNADNLILSATKLAPYCYDNMFVGTNIESVNQNLLPATDLSASYSCYHSMFDGCNKLTNTPKLPATTISDGCYSNMFEGCTELTSAPVLPALTLKNNCYDRMFYGCTKLNSITMLATDISATECLKDWVYNVANTGTFTRSGNKPTIPSGDNGIPSNWELVSGYTVTFDMQGHGEQIAPLKEVIENTTITEPEKPSASGYDFVGWYKDDTFVDDWDFGNDIVTTNITLYAKWTAACLAKGTMITMADGSKEAIENLYEGDLIRVFDHNTGQVSSAKILDYWQYEEKKSGLITLHFTNNIDVNIVTAHSFYNKEENKYILLDASSIDKYIGKHFYNVDNDSWETLLGATYSNEKVETFFIATEGQFNAVAEGMLNVEDGIYFILLDTFDFDEDMKINEIRKANDIERYGLFERSDFEYLTEEAFEKYGFANLKVALGKGIITEDLLEVIKEGCVSYESDNIVEEFVPENIQHSAK